MWQNRIYALIIRRVLGPYLAPSSKRNLQQTLDISLSEGRANLHSIELDGDLLTEKLNNTILYPGEGGDTSKSNSHYIRIRSATIQELNISLSLEYDNHDELNNDQYDAGKGYSNSLGAKLIAKVELNGVDIHIEIEPLDTNNNIETISSSKMTRDDMPKSRNMSDNSTTPSTTTTPMTMSTKGLLQSYVQSALDSLKLNLDVNNLTIQLHSEDSSIQLNLNSLSYKDSTLPPPPPLTTSTSNEKNMFSSTKTSVESNVLMGKEICLDSCRILICKISSIYNHHNDTELHHELIRYDGIATAIVTIMSNQTTTISKSIISKTEFIERHLEIALDDDLVVNICPTTLYTILDMLHPTKTNIETSKIGSQCEDDKKNFEVKSQDEDNFDNYYDDEHDIGILSSILNQKEIHETSSSSPLVYDNYYGKSDLSQLEMNQVSVSHSNQSPPSIDGLFHPNQEGYSHYRNLLASSIYDEKEEDNNTSNNLKRHQKNDGSSIHTSVCFYLKEFCLNIQLNEPGASNNVKFNIIDLNMITNQVFQSKNMNISLDMKTLSIDHIFWNENIQCLSQQNGILQICNKNDEIAVKLKVHLTCDDNDIQTSDITVTLAPLLITLYPEVISELTDMYGDILKFNHHNTNSNLSISSCEKISLITFYCQHISVGLPLKPIDIVDNSFSFHLDDLYERSGYEIEPNYLIRYPTIVFALHDVNMDVSMIKGDIEMSIILHKSVLSIVSPGKSTNLSYYRKFDLLSMEGESQIDPDAVIKISCSKISVEDKSDTFRKDRAKGFFPYIIPLASVKASQQFDDEFSEEDIKNNSMSSKTNNGDSFSHSLKTMKRKIRGADPQIEMLREIESCGNFVSVCIPNIATDITIREKDLLTNIFYHTRMLLKTKSNSAIEKQADDSAVYNSEIAVSVKCNQMSISIQHDFDQPANTDVNRKIYTQWIILDRLYVNCLLQNNFMKHFRFLSDDLTLYEVQRTIGKFDYKSNVSQNRMSVWDLSDSIRKRRFDNSTLMQSNVVLFRSKLSHPLSPKTPALLIDIITRRYEDDNLDDGEISVHLHFYDLTFRYDLESCWVDRFKTVFQGSDCNENKDFKSEKIATVINLFCTVSDCNFDYSSPSYFKIGSRTIIHFGEVRITSHLILPLASFQTYKVSVGNVSIHISNKRGRYDIENARISGSRLAFDPKEICVNARNLSLPHSLDDALFKMGFIVVFSLDFLEAALTLLTICNSQCNNNGEFINAPDANTTVAVSLGNVYIDACKDSFLCFTETINELLLHHTMPSQEELELMRADFFSNQQKQEESKRDSLQERNEDDNSYSVPLESLSLSDVMRYGIFSDDELKGVTNDILYNNSQTVLNDQVKGNSIENVTDSVHMVIDDFYECSKMVNQDTDNLLFKEVSSWTTIDHPWSNDPFIPEGEDQFARWYTWNDDDRNINSNRSPLKLPHGTTIIVEGDPGKRKPRIFNRHIPLQVTLDPLSGGDMGAASYAKTEMVDVKFRLLVTDMTLKCSLYDGFDFPEAINSPKDDILNTKKKLLDDLIGDSEASDVSSIFAKSKSLQTARKNDIILNKPRQTHRYFQLALLGMKLRVDSFAESNDHHLVSCMELNFADIHMVETVSSDKVVKLLGEWVNEEEHPRDSNDGLFMMKMISLHPDTLFAADGQLMGNEANVIVQVLPIRLFIHQVTIRFIRQFFTYDKEDNSILQQDNLGGTSNIDSTPPDMFFSVFKVKPFDIKVDYKPLEVDRSALKDGSYVQLLNLLPLEDMILRLNGVELRNLTGWGAIISELMCKWLQDVSSTQMHKFLTQTRPLHPFSNVGDSMKNFVLLPLKEYKERGNVPKALRKSTSKLFGVVAYEALHAGAKLTGYAAKKLNKTKRKSLKDNSSNMSPSRLKSRQQFHSLESRKNMSFSSSSSKPNNVGDVSNRAIDSLSRGLKEANAKIIIMPYREYQRSGTKGAMKTVVKHLPVAVCAPLSGAAEALSHGLYGASHHLRPDLFEEREASKRFHGDDDNEDS